MIRVTMSSAAVAVAIALTAAAPVAAATVIDASGDFLASFIGSPAADLDTLSANAQYDFQSFRLSSTSNGAIGTTAGALYVWGINRGSNLAPFGAFAPDVRHDAVVVARPDGTGQVVLLGSGPPTITPLAPGAITVSGNQIAVRLAFAQLPTRGAAFADYGFNVWTRQGVGLNSQIADFAPDGTTFAAGAVPEPTSWAMMVVGFGLAGTAVRRRARLAIA